ncbi:Uncharacterized protein EbC_38050 [Erwinia billingiae Eb661]|uniref:Uncharacterized protein n=1 Tax=Erwinia billingiae (strain Eb661) TaxID=634500 RepID=D8MWX9_ERWBE|nr:Uncharacterized protein EbC_38050 [Erwinia billingiae Eb661]
MILTAAKFLTLSVRHRRDDRRQISISAKDLRLLVSKIINKNNKL